MTPGYSGRGRRFGHTRPAPPPQGIDPPKPALVPPPPPAPVQKPPRGRKEAPARLPHGSNVFGFYDGLGERWTGRLVIPGCPVEFEAEARTQFTMFARLDGKYRDWLKAQEKPA